MKRTIRKDEGGFWLSVGGWIIRPVGYTNAEEGLRVAVTSLDPTRYNFGRVRYDNGVTERWKIYNDETYLTRGQSQATMRSWYG